MKSNSEDKILDKVTAEIRNEKVDPGGSFSSGRPCLGACLCCCRRNGISDARSRSALKAVQIFSH